MIIDQCKRCRRLRQKLFLKGERCFSQKCAIIRKPYPPGFKSKRRFGSLSEYGRQLVEKQKIKALYGLSERQLKNYFKKAILKKGQQGPSDVLLSLLEGRMDSVIFNLGWSSSRRQARQIVNHGLILVNGKTAKIPSQQIKVEDALRIKKIKSYLFKDIDQRLKTKKSPSWLSLDKDGVSAKVTKLPVSGELEVNVDMPLIIEYFSK